MTLLAPNPYVVGQWVRGDRFYGRDRQIETILGAASGHVWVIGTRRVGKTSLLKQVEWLTATGERGYLPVFWDLQGADDAAELHLTFHDGLLDAAERLAVAGIEVDRLDADLFAALDVLLTRIETLGLRLLLLCDEAEELIQLARVDPDSVRRLEARFTVPSPLRVVLASSVRLRTTASEVAELAALLGRFGEADYVDRLTVDEARALIRQDKLAPELRPRLDEAVVESIRTRCDHHPYLMQLLCRRLAEAGELERACDQVAGDRMVDHFLSVDLGMLSEAERRCVQTLAIDSEMSIGRLGLGVGMEPLALERTIDHLHGLGVARRDGERVWVANEFLRRRLVAASSATPPASFRS